MSLLLICESMVIKMLRGKQGKQVSVTKFANSSFVVLSKTLKFSEFQLFKFCSMGILNLVLLV